MTLLFEAVCIDAHDPDLLARFWADVLGWQRDGDGPDEIGLRPGDPAKGTELLFLRVPEAKSVKNRLHIDLRPDDQAAEVARVEALGAKRVDIGQGPDVTWVVLADPEGNEFCVLRALRPDET
jgi:predicted enzyme related to lactoylglutathione lyase